MRKIILVVLSVAVISVLWLVGTAQSGGRIKREVTVFVRGDANMTLLSGNAKWVKGPDDETSIDFNGRGGSARFSGAELDVSDKYKDGVDIVMFIEIDSAATSLTVKMSDQTKGSHIGVWCEKGEAHTDYDDDFKYRREGKLTIPFN